MAMDLPAHLTTRPLTQEDARAVFELMAADELESIGRVEIEEADIVADWQSPSFDVSASTVGVFDGERLLGYAEHTRGDRGDACVHPDARGQGIGTWLAGWLADLARSRGATRIGMPNPVDSPGDRLLDALGWPARWTSWVLQLPEGAEVAERPLPEGYTVGQAAPAQFVEAHGVLEDAFLEWSERDREPFEEFEATTLQRPGFEPWMFRVVTDLEGRVAAVAVVLLSSEDSEAYVDRLATRADQRGRGLAQALLVDCFRVGREHGATKSGLSTDSRTGALDLYLKVGMQVTDVWVNRAAVLT